jgi:hypothetical protein
MKFKNAVGQISSRDEGTEMMVKAAVALAYGDICTITGTTQDATSPYLVVTQSAADSIALVGICSEPGGIAAGGVGRMQTSGIADVNVASAAYGTPGAIIMTNGGGAGSGAAGGTIAAGKGVGIAVGDSSATVTQTKVYLQLSLR